MRAPGKIMSDAKDKMMAMPSQSILALKLMVGEFIDIYAAHPKVMTIIVIFELWVHSLLWQHLSELNSILDAFPLLKQLIF